MTGTALHHSTLRDELSRLLEEARERTLLLVRELSEDDFHRQHDPLMSPIIWDLGHIAHFEELWLTQNLDGPIEFSEMPGLYNPLEHPRASRASLALPSFPEMVSRLEQIREKVLERLERVDFDAENPLLANGYVYHLVLQHEYQHNETMLQTLQLKHGVPYNAPRVDRPLVSGTTTEWSGMETIPDGHYSIGSLDTTEAYDNERPQHQIFLHAFEIDRAPVTNGAYMEFMADGGYTDPRHWTPAGRVWLAESKARSPKHWEQALDGWTSRTMDITAPVDSDNPVCHVCYHEAHAFAAWAGKRLPTEMEWEVAASNEIESSRVRAYPWGDLLTPADANIDQLNFGTTAVGSYPSNVSPTGCYGMIGDVWEWTSSSFDSYPGFRSFPYPEYSEAFFGDDYKVLRGGSWATRPGAVRNSFRNWDYPIRRQIFSGFRCARSL